MAVVYNNDSTFDAMNKIIELIKKDEKELANTILSLDKQVYSLEQSIKTSEEEIDRLKKELNV